MITCDVTDEDFRIIIFGKPVKPRMDPALVPDFKGRYLENEKRFFKNNFETVFSRPKSIIRDQLVKTLQLTFKGEIRTQEKEQASYRLLVREDFAFAL